MENLRFKYKLQLLTLLKSYDSCDSTFDRITWEKKIYLFTQSHIRFESELSEFGLFLALRPKSQMVNRCTGLANVRFLYDECIQWLKNYFKLNLAYKIQEYLWNYADWMKKLFISMKKMFLLNRKMFLLNKNTAQIYIFRKYFRIK